MTFVWGEGEIQHLCIFFKRSALKQREKRDLKKSKYINKAETKQKQRKMTCGAHQKQASGTFTI